MRKIWESIMLLKMNNLIIIIIINLQKLLIKRHLKKKLNMIYWKKRKSYQLLLVHQCQRNLRDYLMLLILQVSRFIQSIPLNYHMLQVNILILISQNFKLNITNNFNKWFFTKIKRYTHWSRVWKNYNKNIII